MCKGIAGCMQVVSSRRKVFPIIMAQNPKRRPRNLAVSAERQTGRRATLVLQRRIREKILLGRMSVMLACLLMLAATVEWHESVGV